MQTQCCPGGVGLKHASAHAVRLNVNFLHFCAHGGFSGSSGGHSWHTPSVSLQENLVAAGPGGAGAGAGPGGNGWCAQNTSSSRWEQFVDPGGSTAFLTQATHAFGFFCSISHAFVRWCSQDVSDGLNGGAGRQNESSSFSVHEVMLAATVHLSHSRTVPWLPPYGSQALMSSSLHG